MAARIIGPSIEGMIADMVSAGYSIEFSPDPNGFLFRISHKTSKHILDSGGHLNSHDVDMMVHSMWRRHKPENGYPPREEPC